MTASRLTRRDLLRAGGVGAFTYVAASALALPRAVASRTPHSKSPDQVGAWEAPIHLGAIGVHAQLLPTGKVLYVAFPDFELGSNAKIFDPADNSVTDVSLTTNRNLFCSAYSQLPTGHIFFTGGDRYGLRQTGTKETTTFDPFTQTWTEGPPMREPRWYPSNVALADGTTLIVGGGHTSRKLAESIERYDPVADKLTTLPRSAWDTFGMYPGLRLLPGGRIFLATQEAPTFDEWTAAYRPATEDWKRLPRLLDWPRYEASSVLLPGLREVMVIGGTPVRRSKLDGAWATCEIFDTKEKPGRWRRTEPMSTPRRNTNAVQLADGSVLVVGGNRDALYKQPVLEAELFDPVIGTWTVMAPQMHPRAHHSTAILLPDGRVISAGHTEGMHQFTAEIFSPPYLFKGQRPTITTAPAVASYGAALPITTPDADGISRVALVRPGACTHACDFEQRYVDLHFTIGAGVVDSIAPATGNEAPPGWYMLFMVNDAGVPSVASWVHLT